MTHFYDNLLTIILHIRTYVFALTYSHLLLRNLQNHRFEFLDGLKKNCGQLRVVHRQKSVATLHDEFGVDRLKLLGNQTDLTLLGLFRLNPVVVDTTNVINLIQGTIKSNNVLL